MGGGIRNSAQLVMLHNGNDLLSPTRLSNEFSYGKTRYGLANTMPLNSKNLMVSRAH
jgi:hypothetical protein